jgi:5'-3' exonuclease
MRKRKNKDKQNSTAAITARAIASLPPKIHEPGNKRFIVIDGMHMAYRAFYAHQRFQHHGVNTAVIYGFTNMLKSILLQEKPAGVIVCWEGERHPERIKLLPDYKGHRKGLNDARDPLVIRKGVKRLQKVLYYLGIPQAYNPKMEGDDMVYWITKRMVGLHPITILSGDKDFKQLINRDVQVLNPKDKYAADWWVFKVEHKVEIHQYIDYLCLVGDTSDNIDGYRGIGPVRAAAFLNQFGSIKNYLNDEDYEFSGLNDKDALRTLWKRNRLLMDLRRFNEKFWNDEAVTFYLDKRYPKLNLEKFLGKCRKYGLKTFLFQSFVQPFQKLQDE